MANRNLFASKPFQLIAMAAALGLVVGIGAVYVKGTGYVHAPDGVDDVVVAGGDAACKLSDATKELLNRAAVGDVAALIPAATAINLSGLAFLDGGGKPVNLESFRGRTVLMNLWATWCVPCREEMAALNALQAKAGSATFEVVAVNVDSGSSEKRLAFFEKEKISALNAYHEPEMTLFNALKRQGLAFGLPVTLLIGPDGCLLSAMNGPANWAGDDAIKLVTLAQGIPYP